MRESWDVTCKGYVRFGKYSQINSVGGIGIGRYVMIATVIIYLTARI